MEASETVWRKSTFSAENGCVEVAELGNKVGIRDSKDREGPRLIFTEDEWGAFLAGIRNHEFDIPYTD